MEIVYEIIDYDDSLIKGDFDSYFYNDITLTIKDYRNKITLNSTVHKIFIYGLLESLKESINESSGFELSTFGNSSQYYFDLNSSTIKITGTDLLNNKKKTCIFDKKEFKKAVISFFEKYFKDLEKGNKEILKSNELIELMELLKEFKKTKF